MTHTITHSHTQLTVSEGSWRRGAGAARGTVWLAFGALDCPAGVFGVDGLGMSSVSVLVSGRGEAFGVAVCGFQRDRSKADSLISFIVFMKPADLSA